MAEYLITVKLTEARHTTVIAANEDEARTLAAAMDWRTWELSDEGHEAYIEQVEVLDTAFDIVEAYGEHMETVWIVLHHGFQVGGTINRAGAGDRTFPTREAAEAFIEAGCPAESEE